jgi:hypothetical protein
LDISVIDSMGKLPDGIFSDSMDLCDILPMVDLSCELFGLGFLKGIINIPMGNTLALGSFEGCLSAKSDINFTSPLNPYSMTENFMGQYIPLLLSPANTGMNKVDMKLKRNLPRIGTGIGVGGIIPPLLGPILDLIGQMTNTTDVRNIQKNPKCYFSPPITALFHFRFWNLFQ